MNTETFNKLLDELDGNSLETLKQKSIKYGSSDDLLHNFESGAEIMGSTPAQCAWGYMTKHLVALRDKVERDDFSDRDDFLEKCQDIINYIRFIWLIGNDRAAENVMDAIVDDLKTPIEDYSCQECKYYDMGYPDSSECITCVSGIDAETGKTTSPPSNFARKDANPVADTEGHDEDLCSCCTLMGIDPEICRDCHTTNAFTPAYNPIQRAYDLMVGFHHEGKTTDLDEVIGYLGEALED